jgi:hypothetical protein
MWDFSASPGCFYTLYFFLVAKPRMSSRYSDEATDWKKRAAYFGLWQRQEIFSPLQNFNTDLILTSDQFSEHWRLFPRVKKLACEADHLHVFNGELMNVCSSTFTAPIPRPSHAFLMCTETLLSILSVAFSNLTKLLKKILSA